MSDFSFYKKFYIVRIYFQERFFLRKDQVQLCKVMQVIIVFRSYALLFSKNSRQMKLSEVHVKKNCWVCSEGSTDGTEYHHSQSHPRFVSILCSPVHLNLQHEDNFNKNEIYSSGLWEEQKLKIWLWNMQQPFLRFLSSSW